MEIMSVHLGDLNKCSQLNMDARTTNVWTKFNEPVVSAEQELMGLY